MRWGVGFFGLIVMAGTGLGQESAQENLYPGDVFREVSSGNRVTGADLFPGFIGFVSNPLQSVDPRSLNQIWPLFMSSWVSPAAPLPGGDFQIYGAGLNLALTERLSIAATQGGYAIAHSGGRIRERDRGLFPDKFRDTSREGWLNLGGAIQYALIQDVPNQFLVTIGLRVVAPTGEAEVFQGHGPAEMAPYVTLGKEWGNFHVLATSGYQFPFGGGRERLDVFYANFHFDYRIAGWIYPLFEVNSSFLTSEYEADLLSRKHFFDLGNFESTGMVVSMATGINLVLIQNRLEFGAVYSTSLYTQRNFEFNGMLLKMVLRF